MGICNLSYPWVLEKSWIDLDKSDSWMNLIYENIDWEQPSVLVYGSRYLIPRKTVFLAEKRVNYSYSGLVHYGKGWPKWFCPLLEKVSLKCHTSFNGCLINLYRDGNDRMGWHSDNEPELDSSKVIASLSLGASREFLFKHRKQDFKESLLLQSGDLLVMQKDCQENWLHSLPVRKKILEPRINLTFRCYK